jgi:hypothetical protein
MDDHDPSDYYEEYYRRFEPEKEFLPRDTEIDEAKATLIEFFEQNREKVFYYKQLQVKLEKKHFHWITEAAIDELIGENYIGLQIEQLIGATRVNFVFHPRKWRYYKTPIKTSLEVIRAYSHHTIAMACGEQADTLFFNALMARGFFCHGQDTNGYKEKKWTTTNHNLDFMIEKDEVVYGCEVKNTFDYISREQLSVKLQICRHL